MGLPWQYVEFQSVFAEYLFDVVLATLAWAVHHPRVKQKRLAGYCASIRNTLVNILKEWSDHYDGRARILLALLPPLDRPSKDRKDFPNEDAERAVAAVFSEFVDAIRSRKKEGV